MRLTRCGVVGHPARHSLSPAIHRAAYEALGLDWRYDAHEVSPDAFDAWFAGLGDDWRGLSVTMPHKEAVARLGRPDADVTLTGVANTLVWHEAGDRTAHNTDIPGFIDALDAAGVPALDEATVLGAGATATSAIVALARRGVRRIEVAARRPEAADELVERARAWGIPATAGLWPPRGAGLVVSTLPAAGAEAIVASLEWAGIEAVFDVSYHPWPSALATAAAAAGATVVNGLDLLVHQARHQVRLMTGHDVDVAVLESAARTELRRRETA